MKETPRIMEIERKIGEKLEVFLRREYQKKRRTIANISEEISLNADKISEILRELYVKLCNHYEDVLGLMRRLN